MTKSLPNLIKSNRVLVTNDDVKIIDSNLKDDFFTPFSVKKVESIDVSMSENQVEEEFHEGVMAQRSVVKPKSPELDLAKIQEQAKDIITSAVKEAQTIKEKAKVDASDMLVALKKEAEELGFREGFQQGETSIHIKLAELEEKEKALEQDYDTKVKELGQSVSEIIIALVQKITGVLVEEKKDIILYLISEAITNHTSTEYMIHVSKEDYQVVYAQKEMLKGLVKEGVTIEILEDTSVLPGDCVIETDKRMIDCSINAKLNNLASDLRFLSIKDSN